MNIIGAISTQSVKVAVGILGVVGAQTPVQTCLADCCVATDDSYSTEASPTSGENFGGAIALDGATAVIGAPRKEHGTDTDVGKAFVQTYSGGAWGSATPLTAFPQVEGDFFGNGVGISGDLVIVGAPYAASNDGRAFVFDGSNSWDRSTLTPPSGTTIFGYSVAIDGTVVVVGAPGGSGAAVVFELNQGSWEETAVLTAESGNNGDQFGASVAIDGDVIVVGADGVGGFQEGAAYVFVKDGSWADANEDAILTASDATTSHDRFGYSVDVSGSHVIIGAPFHDVGSTIDGVVYIFEKPGGGWSDAEADYSLVGCEGNDQPVDFGISVGVDGDLAIVGARYGATGNIGSAFIYQYFSTSGNWGFIRRLGPSDGDDGEGFGAAVAISGDFGAVGAPMIEPACQKNPVRPSEDSHVPTTCPASFRSYANVSVHPARTPRSVHWPSSQRKERTMGGEDSFFLNLACTTTWPTLLIATASDATAPGAFPRSVTVPLSMRYA